MSCLRTHIRWRLDRVLARLGLQLVPTRSRPRLHSRAPDEFELHGVRLHLSEPWVTPTVRAAIYDGFYEEPEARIIEATMEPSDRVLEIGCGIGFLGTLASRIATEAVRCYDGNPRMTEAARATLKRNKASSMVTHAVLQLNPDAESTTFYVHDDFWTSSVLPDSEATEITAPVLDFTREVTQHTASYLIVDVEGSETELLRAELPPSVRKICVECHPAVSTPPALNAMLISLLSQNFVLDLYHSIPPVLYFHR